MGSSGTYLSNVYHLCFAVSVPLGFVCGWQSKLTPALLGCATSSSIFTTNIACMAVDYPGLMYFLIPLLTLGMFVYYLGKHRIARASPKRDISICIYLLAILDVAISLFNVYKNIASLTTVPLTLVLTPFKLYAIRIAYHKKTDRTNGDIFAMDVTGAMIEALFFVVGNHEWWIAAFIEQPLHWITMPIWAKTIVLKAAPGVCNELETLGTSLMDGGHEDDY